MCNIIDIMSKPIARKTFKDFKKLNPQWTVEDEKIARRMWKLNEDFVAYGNGTHKNSVREKELFEKVKNKTANHSESMEYWAIMKDRVQNRMKHNELTHESMVRKLSPFLTISDFIQVIKGLAIIEGIKTLWNLRNKINKK